jgi:hypothetical protein
MHRVGGEEQRAQAQQHGNGGRIAAVDVVMRRNISPMSGCPMVPGTVTQLDGEFNILNLWHKHKLVAYSVLYILAKDIVIVSVSTISSESTFSYNR